MINDRFYGSMVIEVNNDSEDFFSIVKVLNSDSYFGGFCRKMPVVNGILDYRRIFGVLFDETMRSPAEYTLETCELKILRGER